MARNYHLFLQQTTENTTAENVSARSIKSHVFNTAHPFKSSTIDLTLSPEDHIALDNWYIGIPNSARDVYEDSAFIAERWQYVWSNLVARVWANSNLQSIIQQIQDLSDGRVQDTINHIDKNEIFKDIKAIEQVRLRDLINTRAKMPEADKGENELENLIPTNIIIRFEFEKQNETEFGKYSEWDATNQHWKTLPFHNITMRIPKKPTKPNGDSIGDDIAIAIAEYTSNLRAHPFTICFT
jgi:hypothetical protein